MAQTRIALVGDFSPEIVAHRAIERCFELARSFPLLEIEPLWIGTEKIGAHSNFVLDSVQGVWCVPGSPYRNAEGALNAIQWARTGKVPFLGTCGGVQHALLEYARHVLGIAEAGHSENDSATSFPLVHMMSCALIETVQRIKVTGGDKFGRYYGAESGLETFHCSYGLNPNFEHLFEASALQIAARADDGGVRAVELREHPFFIGTLFQPERRALAGCLHPLVNAFFTVSCARAGAIGFTP